MRECIKERTAVTGITTAPKINFNFNPKFIFIIHDNLQKVNTRRKIIFKAF